MCGICGWGEWGDIGIWVMLVRTLGVYGHGWDSRFCVLNLSY